MPENFCVGSGRGNKKGNFPVTTVASKSKSKIYYNVIKAINTADLKFYKRVTDTTVT